MWERSLKKQDELVQWWNKRRKRRKDILREKHKNGKLVGLADMLFVRRCLCVLMFLSMCLPTINVFTGWFDYDTSGCDQYTALGLECDSPHEWYGGLHVYGWVFFLFLGVFAFVFDFSIYKRFGKELSVFEY